MSGFTGGVGIHHHLHSSSADANSATAIDDAVAASANND